MVDNHTAGEETHFVWESDQEDGNASGELGAQTMTGANEETNSPPWIELFGGTDLCRVFSPDVKNLQIYLNAYMRYAAKKGEHSAYLLENGIFDLATEQALRIFQIDQAISEIGYAGNDTKAKLHEIVGFIF